MNLEQRISRLEKISKNSSIKKESIPMPLLPMEEIEESLLRIREFIKYTTGISGISVCSKEIKDVLILFSKNRGYEDNEILFKSELKSLLENLKLASNSLEIMLKEIKPELKMLEKII